MPHSLTPASIAAVMVLLAASIGLYGFLGKDRQEASAAGKLNALSEEVATFSKLIEEKGGKEAYRLMSEESHGMDYGKQHSRAHNFGAALYAVEGADGLSVCDAQFSFGCYHEFLGRAIADLGIESVGDLNERCRVALGTNSLSCQHGIGHGVQAYFGYDETHLDQALEVCKSISYNDPIGGCYGGVFMEYNVRTMWGNEARARDYHGDPHEPCGKYDFDYKIACYYWQPQWWRQTVSMSTSTDLVPQFAQMGKYCAEIPDAKVRLHCYEGIGNITAMDSRFNARRSIELCKAIKGEGPQLLCRSVAANHLGIDVSQDEGLQTCLGLPQSAKQYCEQHALNKLNIANRVELPYSI